MADPTPPSTPLGAVVRDVDVRLEFDRYFDAPLDHVWKALTEPDQTERWFGRWSGDPQSGTVEVVPAAEGDAPPETVRIVRCVPPRSLELVVPSPDGEWPLTLELREADAGSALHFVHRLAEPYNASSIGPGWHFYLDRLAAVVDGSPVPDTWDDYYPALADAYAMPA